MNSKTQTERYPLESSPFYRMGRGVDLARFLHLTPKTMTRIIVQRSVLYYFKDEEIGGKQRSLAVPTGEMRVLHDRLKDLFSRIELKPYIFSPRKKRTAIQNAESHKYSDIIVKFDVRQFYPSTTDEHVFQFLLHRMRMTSDVAGRLTHLSTINGKVPFGSPLSPILCALVHDDAFSRAADQFAAHENSVSLWVDDLVVSGTNVTKGSIRDVRRLIASKRMTTHKVNRSTRNDGTVITGIHVSSRGIAPNNKAHRKMRDGLAEIARASNSGDKLKAIRSLIGTTNYFIQVYHEDVEAIERLRARLSWLHNERRALELSGITTPMEITTDSIFDVETAPWL